ncbi:MAG TPA: prenyltransferase/squalene oxidase repeat-containing protein [Planctomycetota bacterium]|nr:prenyltransferase/squalene oxidase repeat-containing protein [Planctomycetota bacterium]
MKTTTAALLALLAVPAAAAPCDEGDLAKRLKETYASAADQLVDRQDASGAWKMGPQGKEALSPSSTALIVASLAQAPEPVRGKFKGATAKGLGFILSKANADGSFGEGPTGAFLKTYTTALCLVALASVERTDRVADAIRGAQAYLKNNQLKEGPHEGGLGYGDAPKAGEKPGRGDLSVTGFSAEGLKMSGLPLDDDFWKLVVKFVRKCQNNSEVNRDPEFLAELKAKNMAVGDDGGLYYAPVASDKASPAGTKKVADKEVIVSYGAMTYDGIKTYLYAGLKKESPEVKSAMDWVRKNWSLDAHPGFVYEEVKRNHLRGIYYYYLLMARALDAYGENPVETFDGKKHDWPKEMAEQFIKVVRDSKMWQNENPAWYEDDPVIATSYVLLTCDLLFRYVH